MEFRNVCLFYIAAFVLAPFIFIPIFNGVLFVSQNLNLAITIALVITIVCVTPLFLIEPILKRRQAKEKLEKKTESIRVCPTCNIPVSSNLGICPKCKKQYL
jgi:hypothetical protein